METSNSQSPPSRWRSILYGALSMLCVLVLVPLILAASGLVNVSARQSLGIVDGFLNFASMRSIAVHASAKSNPFADDSQAVAEALPHYREMCLVCHGAPGIEQSEIAAGLHPKPPDLASKESQELSDGEIFWVINNGIASTGMPAFEEADDANTRWKLVSFVRHLPELSAAERSQLHQEDNNKHDD